MQKVDQATVKALELKAPRLSTLDAKVLRGQVLGGEIFGAFGEQERVAIWGRLQAVDGLIPSLFTFFEDVKYLEACANCVKRLVSLSPRDTVSTALEKAFCDANQRADRAVIQVTESSFTSSPASLADRVDLGYRQLHAYAMRHYLQMPREPKGKELLARLMVNTDETVLRDFADLADRLGFGSPEITALKQCPKSTVARARSERSKPLLVTDGAGEIKKRRCGLPRVEDYVEDGEFLFVNHLHNEEEEQGEGITSFFVRKSVYFAFFGRSLPLTLDSIPRVSDRTDEDMNRSQDAHIPQERREQEQQRQELERQELERQEQEQQRQEQERQEQERQEQEQQRLELERLEQERLEQERLEQERLEQEQERQKQEQQRLELERLELERLEQEQERQELERQEQEQERLEQEQEQERQKQEILKRLEQERQEQERQEQERLDKERLERERLREKQKMIKQERLKKERLKKEEQERKEKEERERQEQEERERQEQEERERQEQEERERQEQEERERQEQQRRERQEQEERERQEQQRRERQEQEERERQEQEERERQEQQRRERQEQEERERQEQEERERQEQEGRERLEYQSLEDQQRLQDQQRLEQEELLEEEELDQEETNQQTEQDVNRGETPANLPSTKKARKPETQLEKRSDNTKIRINFKFREEGFWKDASFLTIDPFDPSEVERVAKKKIREKIRLFDTELRMLTPQECYQAVMIDGTYTILLIRESEIYIDDELQISAMDVRIDALSQQQHMLKRVATNDISQLHHVRKKHHGRVFI